MASQVRGALSHCSAAVARPTTVSSAALISKWSRVGFAVIRARGYKNSSRTGEGEPTLEAVQPLSIDWIRHNGHLTNRVLGGESFFPEGSWSTSVEGFDFSFHHRDGTQSIHFDRTSPKLSQPFKIAPRHGETRDARAPGSTLLTDDPGGLRDPPGP